MKSKSARTIDEDLPEVIVKELSLEVVDREELGRTEALFSHKHYLGNIPAGRRLLQGFCGGGAGWRCWTGALRRTSLRNGTNGLVGLLGRGPDGCVR